MNAWSSVVQVRQRRRTANEIKIELARDGSGCTTFPVWNPPHRLGALARRDPTSIANPWSEALGVTGGTLLIVAILLLLPVPRRPMGEAHRGLTIAAASLGTASLIAFALLVLARSGILPCCGDRTVPTSGRIVPPVLGIVAVCLGLWDLVRSRRDALRIRGSLAGIAMGLCSAIVPIWLWAEHCDLFQSGC